MNPSDPLQEIEELTIDNNELAEIRTSLARTRTYLAAERTFATWVRTGFAIAGAGFTLGNLLKGSASRQLSWIIGAVLIAVGILAFGYGWYGYKKVHDYIERSYRKRIVDTQPFQFSMTSVTAITIILIVASLLAFFLMLT